MDNVFLKIVLEMSFLGLLGVLYYFYQKRKYLSYEQNKGPMVMGLILQSCLLEKKEQEDPELEALIEALDDYLQNKSSYPPNTLLQKYSETERCSKELRSVIAEGLEELRK